MTANEYNDCVNSHADNVYRFILKNLRHEEDSRDIVQTAFEKLWRNRQEIAAEKSKSYLFTIAYHQMIDHIRKNKRISLREDFAADTRADGTVTVVPALAVAEPPMVVLFVMGGLLSVAIRRGRSPAGVQRALQHPRRSHPVYRGGALAPAETGLTGEEAVGR